MRATLLGVGCVALLALTACAGGKQETRAETAQTMEQAVAQQATGSQAGKVQQAGEGMLLLDPYQARAGAAVITLEEKTPVFREGQEPAFNAAELLQPGADVLVYFQERPGEQPLVLGIRVLAADEAQRMQEQYGYQALEPKEDFEQASAYQAGTIQELTDEELVLDPYQTDAGTAALPLGQEVPVVRNGVRVGREVLETGDDVRVYFAVEQGTARIVGVEILTEEEALKEKQLSEQ